MLCDIHSTRHSSTIRVSELSDTEQEASRGLHQSLMNSGPLPILMMLPSRPPVHLLWRGSPVAVHSVCQSPCWSCTLRSIASLTPRTTSLQPHVRVHYQGAMKALWYTSCLLENMVFFFLFPMKFMQIKLWQKNNATEKVWTENSLHHTACQSTNYFSFKTNPTELGIHKPLYNRSILWSNHLLATKPPNYKHQSSYSGWSLTRLVRHLSKLLLELLQPCVAQLAAILFSLD